MVDFIKKTVVDPAIFAQNLVESVTEDQNLRNATKFVAVLYGGPIGLFCCVLCAGGFFFCYAGKMGDTLVVPLSGFGYLTGQKQIISDAWWQEALDNATSALQSSAGLMVSPITIPLEFAKSGSDSILNATGMGEVTEKSAKKFLEALQKRTNDQDFTKSNSQEVGFLFDVTKVPQKIGRLFSDPKKNNYNHTSNNPAPTVAPKDSAHIISENKQNTP